MYGGIQAVFGRLGFTTIGSRAIPCSQHGMEQPREKLGLLGRHALFRLTQGGLEPKLT
jgi:hypothetical protein